MVMLGAADSSLQVDLQHMLVSLSAGWQPLGTVVYSSGELG